MWGFFFVFFKSLEDVWQFLQLLGRICGISFILFFMYFVDYNVQILHSVLNMNWSDVMDKDINSHKKC